MAARTEARVAYGVTGVVRVAYRVIMARAVYIASEDALFPYILPKNRAELRYNA